MKTPTTMAAPVVLAALLVAACGKEPATAQPPAAAPAAAATTPAATPAAVAETGNAAPATTPATETAPATAATATATTAVTPPAAQAPVTAAAAKPAPAATATATATTAAAAAAKPAATSPGRDPGTLTRAEPLRAKPFADAAELASLAAGTPVNIEAREGGWYQVSSGGKTGWVRMLGVRRSSSAGTSIQGLASVASGRAGTGSVVTTTGIRGLDSQALAAAEFNEERIAKAESFRISRQDADAFARQGGLAVRDVPALPAPKK